MTNEKADKKDFFTKVVLSHTTALKRFAITLCKNEFDSDDLVAETVLKAFQNFHRLKDHSKIKQWLFKILNNHFISTYRSQKNFCNTDFSNEGYYHDDSSFSLFEEIEHSNFTKEGNPEIDFISKLTHSGIQQAIDHLPNEFKMALVLCDVEGFSYAEIASITGAPVGTVRSRIARARNILQKELWMYAEDLGIKKSKTEHTEKEHICTCGKKEKITNAITISA